MIIGRTLFVENVCLCNLYCTVCKTLYTYDQILDDLGLVNLGNLYIFPIELFYEELIGKFNNGVPTHSWWSGILESNISVLDPNDLKRKRLQRLISIAGSINEMQTQILRGMVYPDESFQCCKNPEVICLDGIVCSVKTERITRKNLVTPWLLPNNVKTRASYRKDRNCINLPEGQNDLLHK